MDNLNIFENQLSEDNFLGVESFSEAPVMSLEEMYGLLSQVQEQAFLSLQEFAAMDDFAAKMASVFGEGNDYSAWQTAFATSTFTDFPTIEILSGSVLQGANAAYAGATNTIYFSQDFLAQYANNSQALMTVFLEEFGHHVDWQVNAGIDTPGDEGELFSTVIHESYFTLSPNLIHEENDHSILEINGSKISTEKSDIIYSSSNPLSEIAITNLLVFRNVSPSSPDYNSHIRYEDQDQPAVIYNITDFMENGAGRYAYPALFGIVKFFLMLHISSQETIVFHN